MISSLITRTSAFVLILGGLVLLFAPDVALPRLVPGYPASAAWIGSLLGSSWLGLAALNWSHRATLLGGIYGRPVVLANFALYLMSALTLVRVVLGTGTSPALWFIAAPVMALAIAYAALLFRGPFDPLSGA